MALYNGMPVILGADEDISITQFDDPNQWRSNASYFEVFDPATEEWSDLKRNPFFSELTKTYYAGASVTKEDSFLIFGGWLRIYDRSSKSPKFNFI